MSPARRSSAGGDVPFGPVLVSLSPSAAFLEPRRRPRPWTGKRNCSMLMRTLRRTLIVVHIGDLINVSETEWCQYATVWLHSKLS